MKRIAMVLCLIFALGWISDTGMLTLRLDNGWQVKGIPMLSGYTATIYFKDTITSVYQTSNGLFLINSLWTKKTRLGNGWLFEFKEIRGGVPFLPITR